MRRPSTALVHDRCLSDDEYELCRYYVPPEEGRKKKEGLLKFAPSSESEEKETFEQRYKPYKLIHALLTEPSSGCPYLESFRGTDGKWYALCKVLNRLLTFSEIKLCEHHWKSCPLYKNAGRLVSET